MAATLEALTRRRLLEEMLGKVHDGQFAVLVMDAEATRIISAACRVSELLNFRISLVDDLFKRREPQRLAAGVYFLTPTPASVARLLEDWQPAARDGRGGPTYASAHVFFTSKLPPQLLASIKGCPGLKQSLKALAEVNLEYLQAGSHSFIVDEPHALQTFYGSTSDEGQHTTVAIKRTAARLATVFATLRETPAIRFRFPRPPDMDDDDEPALEPRALVAQRLAIELDSQLQGMQASGLLPQTETCELVVLDRGFDTVAPVIHDWTYEPMVHDLLHIRNNAFSYQAQTRAGAIEEKVHMLNDKDSLWARLRHQHIAIVFESITSFKDELMKNSVARGTRGGGSGAMDAREIARLVASMPQYQEQLAQLGVHSEMCERLRQQQDARQLLEVGKLEQDIIFGVANSTEMLAFFTANPDLDAEDKVRLFMCYVSTKPEKLDEVRAAQWQKVTHLTAKQFLAVSNLEYLGIPVFKRHSKGTSKLFGKKRKAHVRQVRAGESDVNEKLSEDTTRFRPLLEELLEEMAAGKMSLDDYPYVRQPLPAVVASFAAQGSGSSYTSKTMGGAQSVRTKPSWTSRAAGIATGGAVPQGPGIPALGGARAPSATAADHPLASAPSASGSRVGKRIIAFVVGGVVRSEVRVVHQLSQKLSRQISLGSTSIDTPSTFLEAIRDMTPLD